MKYKKNPVKTLIPYLGLHRKVYGDPKVLLKECVDSKGTPTFYQNRDTLILRFIPLALSIASGFDLVGFFRNEIPSVAIEELVHAIDRLIERKGHPNIGAYLNITIRGTILNYIKREELRRLREPLFDPYDNNPMYEGVAYYSDENKVLFRDIINVASSGIKKLSGVDEVFNSSKILVMKMEGHKNREICDRIKKETGHQVTVQRVDQMVHKIYSVLGEYCK